MMILQVIALVCLALLWIGGIVFFFHCQAKDAQEEPGVN